MSLNFFILCIIIAQAFGLPVFSTYQELKKVASKKCPFLENSVILKPKPEFLEQCDSVNVDVSKMKSVSKSNQDAVLCLVFFSTFESLCTSIGQTNGDSINLSNAIESLKSSNITDVCTLLGNITETDLLKPFILKALGSPKTCSRLCSDFDNTPTTICSFSSFMWAFSTVLDSEKKAQSLKKPMVLVPEPKVKADLEMNVDQAKDTSMTASNALSVHNKSLSKVTNTPNILMSQPSAFVATDEASGVKVHGEKTKQNDELPKTQQFSTDGQTEMQAMSKTKMPSHNVQNLTTAKASNIQHTTKTEKLETKPAVEVSSNIPIEIQPSHSDDTKNNDGKKVIDNQDNGISEHSKTKQETKKVDDTNIQPVVQPVDYTNFDIDEAAENDFDSLNELPPKQVQEKPTKGEISFTDQNIYGNEQVPKSSEVKLKPVEVSKPREIDEDSSNMAANFQNQNIDDSDSYFFSYFMMVCVMFICGYVAYHNKQKILALVLEGRKGRRPSRSRRPNSANYHKLDTTLEEAVTSSCNKNTTQVIY